MGGTDKIAEAIRSGLHEIAEAHHGGLIKIANAIEKAMTEQGRRVRGE